MWTSVGFPASDGAILCECGVAAERDQRLRRRPERLGEPIKAVSRTRYRKQIVEGRPEERYATCVPLVPLAIAAGAFGDPQYIEGDNWEWVAIDSGHRLRHGMFIAQVVGRSMEPAIPDGASVSSRRPSPALGTARPCSSNFATPSIPRLENATPSSATRARKRRTGTPGATPPSR